jgi:hypothetical protein
MRCIEDIQTLAWMKHNDAFQLLEVGGYDSAFYLGGYTVELMLKARICKQIGIDNFFDFEDDVEKPLGKEAYKPFKVHDVTQLSVLGGMRPDLQVALQDKDFGEHWTSVCKWSEKYRYIKGKQREEVDAFLNSVKIVSKWIQELL